MMAKARLRALEAARFPSNLRVIKICDGDDEAKAIDLYCRAHNLSNQERAGTRWWSIVSFAARNQSRS